MGKVGDGVSLYVGTQVGKLLDKLLVIGCVIGILAFVIWIYS